MFVSFFIKVYHDSDEGRRYMQFYKVHEFPHVAILDQEQVTIARSYVGHCWVSSWSLLGQF